MRQFFSRKPVRIITVGVLAAAALTLYIVRDTTGNSFLELLFP